MHLHASCTLICRTADIEDCMVCYLQYARLAVTVSLPIKRRCPASPCSLIAIHRFPPWLCALRFTMWGLLGWVETKLVNLPIVNINDFTMHRTVTSLISSCLISLPVHSVIQFCIICYPNWLHGSFRLDHVFAGDKRRRRQRVRPEVYPARAGRHTIRDRLHQWQVGNARGCGNNVPEVLVLLIIQCNNGKLSEIVWSIYLLLLLTLVGVAKFLHCETIAYLLLCIAFSNLIKTFCFILHKYIPIPLLMPKLLLSKLLSELCMSSCLEFWLDASSRQDRIIWYQNIKFFKS